MDLSQLATPCLVLDRGVLARNTRRMSERMTRLGVNLRPHLKTAKCVEVARLATEGHSGGITVSTLAEAEWFAHEGIRDILLAVGIAPGKIGRAAALIRRGVALTLITDNIATARTLIRDPATQDVVVRMLVEVDTGDGRCGVAPDSDVLLELARLLHDAPNVEFAGVLTHAGHSYGAASIEAIIGIAEDERAGVTAAAGRIRAAGIPCETVSAGSTPTATHVRDLTGVTEMRPGVYMFGDLDQTGLGSLTRDDIAMTVLATVIGHYPARNELICDAGGLAMSKDTSATRHDPAIGYGLVRTATGDWLDGLYVRGVSQEHGRITSADPSSPLPFDRLPVGSRVRIVPNHACMTAAAHPTYFVVDGDGDSASTTVVAEWTRCNGW